jgi:membrane-bound ClpP family serine protease
MPVLDFWDYVTFAAIFIIGIGFILLAMLILGLPGKIALARKHPEAEAVNLMGWLGFLAVVPWIQALMWAFKPTDVVDIRRFPKEQGNATEEELAKLAGQIGKAKPEISVKTTASKTKHSPIKEEEKI